MEISLEYTFVRKLHKSMIAEIFLSKEQIEELQIQVVGRKAKEKVVQLCIKKSICSRKTAYDALNTEKYDGESALHQKVVNEAVKYLKETFGVTFPWAEIEDAPLAEA